MGALQHWQRLQERREKLTEKNDMGLKLTQAEISGLEDQERQIPKLKKELWGIGEACIICVRRCQSRRGPTMLCMRTFSGERRSIGAMRGLTDDHWS